MDGKSLDIKKEKFEKLKEIMPEVFTEGDKIDVEKLKLTLGEDVNVANERYVLNWAGKSDAFKVLQSPTTATLSPDKEESINFDTTENIFIEGENLEVLKVLQKSYYGKIKMIYIDPPYNTGNDSFIYPDKFSETKEEYLKRIGEKDEQGYLLKEGLFRKNSKENGQYHSNWLNMMYPRLFLAKNLLRDDGVIFVSIDDNEVHNLKMIMNEIFGEENFVAQIVWRKSDNQANIGSIARVKEYILVFSKKQGLELKRIKLSERAIKEYRYKDEIGKFRRKILLDKTRGRHYYELKTSSGNILNGPWMIKENEFRELERKGGIYWTKGGDEQPYGKIYLDESEGQISNDLLGIEYGTNQEGSVEVESFFRKRYFDFPKPTSLIQHFINIGTLNNDIILDFFSGSGTTAQAVYELNKEDGGNRKYILVQLPEKTNESTEAFKAGYKTIADIGKERIRRVIKKIKNEKESKPELFKDKEPDLGFKVFKLKHSNFKLWRGDVIENGDDLSNQLDIFENPVKEGSEEENILYELILKSGYELTTKIEMKDGLYSIDGDKLVIVLSKVDVQIIKSVLNLKPQKCIILDSLFNGNDKLKTNTVLQMKDAGVEFKTV